MINALTCSLHLLAQPSTEDPLVLFDTGEIKPEVARELFDQGRWSPDERAMKEWVVETIGEFRHARHTGAMNLDLIEELLEMGQTLLKFTAKGKQEFRLSEVPR